MGHRLNGVYGSDPTHGRLCPNVLDFPCNGLGWMSNTALVYETNSLPSSHQGRGHASRCNLPSDSFNEESLKSAKRAIRERGWVRQ